MGWGVVLLTGGEVGAGCLIAAGAVVAEGARIPDHSLVMGLPGKVRRATTEADRERIARHSGGYVTLARRYLQGYRPHRGRQGNDR